MTRPVYSFRPNLKNPEHQRAWEKFQSVPEGQKSQYLVQAILEKEDRKWLEEVIQKTIKESVRELGICGTTEQSTMKPSSEEIPDQMMDFYFKWKIFKGGEAYDCTIHTLLDLLGVRQEMHRYLWWVL